MRMQAPGGPAIQITTVRLVPRARRMSALRRRGPAGEAGFTLIEVLMATLLMTIILAALATVTAQWLPNWNRGMARVQRAERLAMGLDRIVADLSVAEMIPLNGDSQVAAVRGLGTGGDLRANRRRSQCAARPRNRQADREGRETGPRDGSRARIVYADAMQRRRSGLPIRSC